jgi:uncharacterized protein YceK
VKPSNEIRRAQGTLAGIAILALLVIVLATALLLRGDGSGAVTPQQVPRSGQPSAPASSTPAPTLTQTGEVRWQDVAGVQLPFSAVDGPHRTADGLAAGYSHTQAGAALAAIQFLARTSATAGPNIYQPVLDHQVTGSNLPAMRLLLDQQYHQLQAKVGVAEGAVIPGNDATVAGYLVRAYSVRSDGQDAATAPLGVVLSSAQLQAKGEFVEFEVSLIWLRGDWQLIAPPQGDWSTVAEALTATPTDLHDYHQIG